LTLSARHRKPSWLVERLTRWLVCDRERSEPPQCDFERLCAQVRPGDVVLVEGRSRVSEVIAWITLSPWTHAALYLGRLNEIRDPGLRARVADAYDGDPNEPILVEALLGEGTVAVGLKKYRDDHLRICRPRGLRADDRETVLRYAIEQIGQDYDFRQILDLARFFFPWSILPRRWRSSLFQLHAGTDTRAVCSSMIARAFMGVRYPILPVIQAGADGAPRYYRRNFRLFTPRDFDFSPYFEVVKYPLGTVDECLAYRELPWDESGLYCNWPGDCFRPDARPAHDAGLSSDGA